jgi:nicotinamidase-related amidase
MPTTIQSEPPTELTPLPDNIKRLQEERLEQIFNKDHAGLLIIDLQNDFLSPKGKLAALWGKDVAPMLVIIPTIEKVAAMFYEANRPVIRSMVYDDPEMRTQAGLDRFLLHEFNNRETSVICVKGTWGANLFVPARAGDVIIEKYQASARLNTNLSQVIAAHNITTLYIAGIKTQRCVVATIRDLVENEPSLHVVTLEDCVATNDEGQQQAGLAEIKSLFPPVIPSSELIQRWS